MNITNRKAYTYKMNLVPANILGLIIFILLIIFTYLIGYHNIYQASSPLIIIYLILYLSFHEIIHGIGYYLGGTKRENISYGICLEKGILYCMSYEEITKKNILISLQMPFMTIGIITYVIGIIMNMPILVLLSIINLVGASMDLVMFLYILKLPKDVTYSESGNPDEFVLISNTDLSKKKSMFIKVIDEGKYNKKDYEFENIKKITISKTSIILLIFFILLSILSALI